MYDPDRNPAGAHPSRWLVKCFLVLIAIAAIVGATLGGIAIAFVWAKKLAPLLVIIAIVWAIYKLADTISPK